MSTTRMRSSDDRAWLQQDIGGQPMQDADFAVVLCDHDVAHAYAIDSNMTVPDTTFGSLSDHSYHSQTKMITFSEIPMGTGHLHPSFTHNGRELVSHDQPSPFAIPMAGYEKHQDFDIPPPDQIAAPHLSPTSDISTVSDSGDERTLSRLQPHHGMREFELADTAKVRAFLATRLKKMQQVVAKKIAKAWIKGICPKKQAKFPYQNKARKAKDSVRQDVPGWWPAINQCRFVEPDHINRNERMHLCLHLLTLRPSPQQLMEWNNGSPEPNPTHVSKGWTAFLEELAGPSIFDGFLKEGEEQTHHRKLWMSQMYTVAALEEEFDSKGGQATTTKFCWLDDDEGQRLISAKRPYELSDDDPTFPSSQVHAAVKRNRSCIIGSSDRRNKASPSAGPLKCDNPYTGTQPLSRDLEDDVADVSNCLAQELDARSANLESQSLGLGLSSNISFTSDNAWALHSMPMLEATCFGSDASILPTTIVLDTWTPQEQVPIMAESSFYALSPASLDGTRNVVYHEKACSPRIAPCAYTRTAQQDRPWFDCGSSSYRPYFGVSHSTEDNLNARENETDP